jgi:hypothetical protein
LAAKHHLVVELLLGPEECLLDLGDIDKGSHEYRVIREKLLQLGDACRRQAGDEERRYAISDCTLAQIRFDTLRFVVALCCC